MSRPRATSVRCVIKKPVRGKRTRDATNRISGYDRDILWKTFPLSSKRPLSAKRAARNPRQYAAFLQQSASNDAPTWRRCSKHGPPCPQRNRKPPPKIKDPSGGTTGRVKAIWALGVDGRSRLIQPSGRDNRSHRHKSAAGAPTFKPPVIFLTFPPPGFRGVQR